MELFSITILFILGCLIVGESLNQYLKDPKKLVSMIIWVCLAILMVWLALTMLRCKYGLVPILPSMKGLLL